MNTLNYFMNLPDKSLIILAINDWKGLELICYAITLDLYFFGEKYHESDM
jgi:hypothetical protein